MLLEDLNEVQQRAVTHEQGPLLILAGAGSGKTRILTRRLGYLVRQGEDPRRILAITFTNKAANEMKERVAALLGRESHGLWVSTFHATCLRMLRREFPRVGRRSDFSVMDTTDQKALVRQALKELQLNERQFSPARMRSAISGLKNQLVAAEDYKARAGGYFEEKLADIYLIYQRLLRENNGLDFDDLIVETVELLRHQDQIRQSYQEHFRHVLVDEYQDTNHPQYLLVKMWSGKYQNLFVVGDEDQSIYGFRGADIRNILDFEEDYPQATIIKLEQNYRSTQNILDAAHHVIEKNSQRKGKRLWTSKQADDITVLCTVDDEKQEVRYVMEEIEKRVAAGARLSDCAILYRTHAQSRALEEGFVRHAVPYTIVGGTKFYERKEIKDLLAYLRLMVNDYDFLSMARAAQNPRRGLGATSIERLEAHARKENLSVVEVLSGASGVSGLRPQAVRAAVALAEILEQLRQDAQDASAGQCINLALEGSGLLDELAKQADSELELEGRQENLQEFITVAEGYDEDQGGGLTGFLEWVSLMTDVDTYKDVDDKVVLMTIHSAKGLEFDTVFLVGMEEGRLPHMRSIYEEGEVEEERRLCYVGMTRAENQLYLVTARHRSLAGSSGPAIPSRFLKDIPLELVEETHYPQRTQVGGMHPSPMPRRPRRKLAVDVTFSPGDKVKHGKWGNGTVVAVQGQGEDAKITIAFETEGLKQLLAKFAPLERAGE